MENNKTFQKIRDIEASMQAISLSGVSMKNTQQEFKNFGRVTDILGKQLRGLSQDGLRGMIGALEDISVKGKSAQDVLKSLSINLFEGLIKNIIHNVEQTQSGGGGATVLSTIGNSFGDLLGFRAGGGQVSPGGSYIVGERGPELLVMGQTAGSIVPNNKISSGASPSMNVTVINNTSANIQTQEKTGANGQRELQIMVDNMVADSLVRGNSTRNVLRHVFGVNQQLASR